MEEIYLLMFLLVIFGIAIYVIIQIPEVKDYIMPPSSNYGINTLSNGLSNGVLNIVTLSRSNGSSNSNCAWILSNCLSNNNSSNCLSNILSNCMSNKVTLSGSNGPINITGVPSSSQGSTYSSAVIGTPLSSNLEENISNIGIYLNYSLFDDGSVPRAIIFQKYQESLNRYVYLSSSQQSNLSNLAILDLNSSNYQTIEQISDHLKYYVLSNIPPITTSNLFKFSELLSNATDDDVTFSNLYNDLYNNWDDYSYFLNYTTNWYLSNLRTATRSNFVNIATSFIITNILSNNPNI